VKGTTISPTWVNEARQVNVDHRKHGGADQGLGDIAQKLGIAAAARACCRLQRLPYSNSSGNDNIGDPAVVANKTWHYAKSQPSFAGAT